MSIIDEIRSFADRLKGIEDPRETAANDVQALFGWRPTVVDGGVEVTPVQYEQLRAWGERVKPTGVPTIFGIPVLVKRPE